MNQKALLLWIFLQYLFSSSRGENAVLKGKKCLCVWETERECVHSFLSFMCLSSGRVTISHRDCELDEKRGIYSPKRRIFPPWIPLINVHFFGWKVVRGMNYTHAAGASVNQKSGYGFKKTRLRRVLFRGFEAAGVLKGRAHSATSVRKRCSAESAFYRTPLRGVHTTQLKSF